MSKKLFYSVLVVFFVALPMYAFGPLPRIIYLHKVSISPHPPVPPIRPLDLGDEAVMLFSAELLDDEVHLVALDAAENVEITILRGDSEIYSSLEDFVGMDEEFSISTLGWQDGDYSLCITYGDVTLLGYFSFGDN